MAAPPIARRASPLRWGGLAALVLLWADAAGAAAQVPDTVQADTVVVEPGPLPLPPETEADTLPRDTTAAVQDTIGPAPNFPEFPHPFPTGWAFARYEWSREELLRYRGLSVLELLERAPGLVATRAGGFGRPAGLSAFGPGGGRLRVFVDGYELDPLATASFDLQQIGLVDLQKVRVERTLSEVRVELSTIRLPDERPYSEIEIGAGTPDVKLLRALLARTIGERATLTAGYDLVSTDGYGTREPFQFGGGRLGVSYALAPETGLKLELSQANVERESELFGLNAHRRELILRGRSEPIPGLTVDGLVARSWWFPQDSVDFGDPEEVDTLDLSSTQAMLRAGYRIPLGYAEAVARVRDGGRVGVAAPGTDLAARVLLRPLPWVTGEAEVRSARLAGEGGTEASGTVRAGAFGGFSLFGTVGAGERVLGVARDTLIVVEDTVVVEGEEDTEEVRIRRFLRPLTAAELSGAGGVRVGAEWTGRGATIGAAAVALEEARVIPFGLAFDRGVVPLDAGTASGFEVYGSLPVPFTGEALRLEGWYSSWSDLGFRPYLPLEHGRLVLEYHDLLVEGEFEPTLRIEGVYRGRTVVPGAGGEAFAGTTEPYSLLNLYLQLRILDVRAFLIYENLLNNREARDLLDLAQPGPRLLYGVRWFFRN